MVILYGTAIRKYKHVNSNCKCLISVKVKVINFMCIFSKKGEMQWNSYKNGVSIEKPYNFASSHFVEYLDSGRLQHLLFIFGF